MPCRDEKRKRKKNLLRATIYKISLTWRKYETENVKNARWVTSVYLHCKMHKNKKKTFPNILMTMITIFSLSFYWLPKLYAINL